MNRSTHILAFVVSLAVLSAAPVASGGQLNAVKLGSGTTLDAKIGGVVPNPRINWSLRAPLGGTRSGVAPNPRINWSLRRQHASTERF